MVGLLIAGCGGSKPDTFDVKGSLTLYDDANSLLGNPCRGSGGFADLYPGSPAVVVDASGTKLALGKLTSGRGDGGGLRKCRLSFTVRDVPTGEGPYALKIGNREEFPFKQADSDAISLTIGMERYMERYTE